ncbi:hypothetical protein BU15DRAFT_60900 [Melanogaster broomeanus]|nr:hypothetical protein BU15DRAFT_60900 [Melanogaster broomeanus]
MSLSTTIPPAPNILQLVGNEYYFAFRAPSPSLDFSPEVGVIHRNAVDVVTVIPDCKLEESVAPDLVGASKIISFVSNIQPKDSISSSQCCHFTRTVYRVMQTVFVHSENWWRYWDKSSSVKNTETIVALLRTAQRHEEVAAKALAEVDKDTDRAGGSGGAASDPQSNSTPLITI